MQDSFQLYQRLAHLGDTWKFKRPIVNKSELVSYLDAQEWIKYNKRTPSERFGLSVTSIDGEITGLDLDSLPQINRLEGSSFNETSFNTPTKHLDVAHQLLLQIPKSFLGRTHFIKLKPGGFFPMHRDHGLLNIRTFRIFVPISNCDYPNMLFTLDKDIISTRELIPYFINTAKAHSVVNIGWSDSIFLIANVILNEESINWVNNNIGE